MKPIIATFFSVRKRLSPLLEYNLSHIPAVSPSQELSPILSLLSVLVLNFKSLSLWLSTPSYIGTGTLIFSAKRDTMGHFVHMRCTADYEHIVVLVSEEPA